MSYQLPTEFLEIARLNGLLLHDESGYLKKQGLAQISIIGPQFDEAFKRLQRVFEWYQQVK